MELSGALEGIQLYLEAEDDALIRASFQLPGDFEIGARDDTVPVLKQAARELAEYCAGERKRFEVAFELSGTEFQCQVWAELFRIPFGETRSYHEIAEAVGRPKAVRAVGAANGANPLAVIVPCHRVIGSDGTLTGYAGGMDVKRRLLVHEGLLLV